MQTDSVVSFRVDGHQRLLTCSEPGKSNKKHTPDDLKATNTQQRLQIQNNKCPGQIADWSICIRAFVVSACRAMESPDCGRGSHTTMGPNVLFPLFKGTPFFPPGDKAQEMVSDMLAGKPMEKNTHRITAQPAACGAERVGGELWLPTGLRRVR